MKTETKTTNPIRTFNHVRKGILTGHLISDDGEWITIQVTENFQPKFLGNGGGYNNLYSPGEQITVRKSLISDL